VFTWVSQTAPMADPTDAVHAPMAVVRLGVDDLNEALTLAATELFGRLVTAGAALGWIEPPSQAEVSDLLGDLVRGSSRGEACLVIAHLDGRLAALGSWGRYTRATHRPHADVQKVAVDPAQQGRGLGRRLMTELIEAAMEQHVEVLTLDLRADNAAAIGLYESLGFDRYGRLKRFIAVGEARYDKLFYALDLREVARNRQAAESAHDTEHTLSIRAQDLSRSEDLHRMLSSPRPAEQGCSAQDEHHVDPSAHRVAAGVRVTSTVAA
jgi:ribosomal protein S18 acetylase RimI-like enzyme